MRVLFIAYHFPPDAAIGAVRPYQFSRLLSGYGIESWILTVEPRFAESWDDNLRVEGIPEERILRTKVEKTKRRGVIEKLSIVRSGVRSAFALGGAGAAVWESPIADALPFQTTAFKRRLDSWLTYPDRLAG